MRGPVQKTCEHCGQVFQCGGYQCWCGSLGVTEQQMDWIAARYKDCLCPACLGKIARGEPGSQVPQIDQRTS
ncbi:MAG: cysteine-rich CWC family protein [Nitrospira sp.]|nr:cysteine-rich CWC family protein [Nitrospira sp.]MBH0185012.1 cysteine-rich CWC family protein [Nitrospira sp.]